MKSAGKKNRNQHQRRRWRYGLSVALLLLVIGAICRVDWKYLPVAFFLWVVVAWGRLVYEVGIRPSCAIALRSLLTGLASVLTFVVVGVTLVAVVFVFLLVTTYHGDVDSWRKELIPGQSPRMELSDGHTSTLGICALVGGGLGVSLGAAGWYVASCRWAVLGVVGCPLLWLALYWPETFKAGPVRTSLPLIGVVDGGLIMLYLSTLGFALGGWLGDRRRGNPGTEKGSRKGIVPRSLGEEDNEHEVS
jgi:hypothetical protein